MTGSGMLFLFFLIPSAFVPSELTRNCVTSKVCILFSDTWLHEIKVFAQKWILVMCGSFILLSLLSSLLSLGCEEKQLMDFVF